MRLNRLNTSAMLIACIVACAALTSAGRGWCGDFFELQRPSHLSLTLFAGGYGNDQYGNSREGFQFEQSVTRFIGLVGAASAYQVYKGTAGFDNPLSPAHKSSVRNFGVFEGGIDFIPFPGTSLILLGGEDVGDAHAPVIEGDFSSWLRIHTRHPVNLAFSGYHFYQNGVTSGTWDLRVMAMSTAEFILLLGAGGAIWGGGSVSNVKAHGGPDIGLFLRRLHLNVSVQGGYGSAHTYGIVTCSRHFSWEE
jgi:hypothetical protein